MKSDRRAMEGTSQLKLKETKPLQCQHSIGASYIVRSKCLYLEGPRLLF